MGTKRYSFTGVLAKGTKKTRKLHYIVRDRLTGEGLLRVRQIKKARRTVAMLEGSRHWCELA